MMEQKMRFKMGLGGLFLALFAVLNVLLKTVDVAVVGPQEAKIGFSTVNAWFRDLVGVHEGCYRLTEVLGYLALLSIPIFGCLGLWQWLKGKSFGAIEKDLLLLAGFYVIVGVVYVAYEVVIINYRPIMPEGVLEASFPSSHTMLSVCVMSTAIMQIRRRIPFRTVRRPLVAICGLMMVAIVIGRVLSGYHWLTDILGGLLISVALVFFYAAGLDALYVHRNNRVIH